MAPSRSSSRPSGRGRGRGRGRGKSRGRSTSPKPAKAKPKQVTSSRNPKTPSSRTSSLRVVRKRPAAALRTSSSRSRPSREVEDDRPSEDEDDGELTVLDDDEDDYGPITGACCTAMPFIDARAVGRGYFRTHVNGIVAGHLIEFMVYSETFIPTASAVGLVQDVKVYDDGAELLVTYPLGSFPHIQDYLHSMTSQIGMTQCVRLHLCSSSIHTCPGLGNAGVIHSDNWRVRYPEDLHTDWTKAVPASSYKFMRSLGEDVDSVFDTPGRNVMDESPSDDKPPSKGDKKSRRVSTPSMLEVEPASRQKSARQSPPTSKSHTMEQVANLKKQLQVVKDRELGRKPLQPNEKRRPRPMPAHPPKKLSGARFGAPPVPAHHRDASTVDPGHHRFAGAPSSSAAPRTSVPSPSRNVDEIIRKRSALPESKTIVASFMNPGQLSSSHLGSGIVQPQQRRAETRDSSRRRRRDRSSQSSSGSDSNELDFRAGRRYGAGQENAIQRMALTKPGKLLKSGLKQMYRLTNPSSVVSAADIPEIPATAVNYLHTIVEQTQRQHLSTRDARELKTLATAVDLLARGQLSSVGDLLMQRFKSIETSVRDQHWDVARQQELIPEEDYGASSLREHELAAKMALRRKSMSALGDK